VNRAALVDAAFVAVLCMVALFGFGTTYSGWSFLLVGAVGVLLGVIVGWLGGMLRQPVLMVAVLTVVVFFLLGGAVALRGQVLPTVPVLASLADLSVHGWMQLLTTLPPVDTTGPLLVIPYILGLVGGAAGFTLARRVRLSIAPVAVPVALLVSVILLGTSQPAALLLQGAVFTCIAGLWAALRAARRHRRVGGRAGRASRVLAGAGILGVTVAVAAVTGPVLPGAGDNPRLVLRDLVQPPVDVAAFPSPLVGFRKYTKDANQLWDQALFTMSSLPPGTTVRIATLDDYDGSVWGASNRPGAATSFQRVGTRIEQSVIGTQVSVRVTIKPAYAQADDLDAWLPTVGAATAVDFTGPNAASESDTFRYNLGARSGVVTNRLSAGDSYTVQAVIDSTTAPVDPQPLGQSEVDSKFTALAASRAVQWAGKASGPWNELQAVATYLHANGAYSDGGPGETQFLPGHGAGRLGSFLNGHQPVGDDEQYAAAFALIANDLGMPARVVLGATPEADGTVKGKDVHAWVEVHVADGRWIPIPQTTFMPDTSRKPDQQPPQKIQDASAAVVPPPNAVRPPSTLDDAEQAATRGGRVTGDPGPEGWQLPEFVVAALTWGGPPILLGALVCALVVAIKTRRRSLRRSRGTPVSRFATGWLELVDHARDLGVAVSRGGTRREQAGELARYDIGGLAFAADATVFGPGLSSDQDAELFWREIDRARRAMSAGVGRWRRIRAALNLTTLRPGWGRRR
jgi:transglutaminase-like putative cysteine protease